MKCGREPSTIRLPGSCPDLLLFKYFPPSSRHSPGLGLTLNIPKEKGWEGFLHQLLPEAKACNSLHSREHPHRTEFHLHVGSSQEPNTKYPATWAQASKAKLSGIAFSVHSEGNREGKGICPPAPRLSSVPPCQSRAAPARTGRQTGLPSDCMPPTSTQPG